MTKKNVKDDTIFMHCLFFVKALNKIEGYVEIISLIYHADFCNVSILRFHRSTNSLVAHNWLVMLNQI